MTSNVQVLSMLILNLCRRYELPPPEKEYSPIPGRKFRCDWAWPEFRLAVEYEGGTWIGGGHTRGDRFHRDVEKYNLLALHGWTLIRITADMVPNAAREILIEALRPAIRLRALHVESLEQGYTALRDELDTLWGLLRASRVQGSPPNRAALEACLGRIEDVACLTRQLLQEDAPCS